ncbi:MAG: hypothetical protein O2955_04505 [Planctomycetota bacterium]|nr:hypothetical protein [Planctomycetota bacterium]MDA1211751.1 hypothetical protein [Planctomycetota bacterium]
MSSSSSLSFGRAVPLVQGLTDVEFLRQVQWRQSTPTGILQAVNLGDRDRFQKGVLKELAGHFTSPPAGKSSRRYDASEWNFFPFESTERFQALLNALKSTVASPVKSRTEKLTIGGSLRTNGQEETVHNHNGRENGQKHEKNGKKVVQSPLTAALAEWLHDAKTSQGLTPPEWLLLADVISLRGRELASDVFCKLWRQLLTDAVQWSHTPVEQFAYALNVAQQGVISGEIPWRSGLLFSQVRGVRAYRVTGQQALDQILERQIDVSGMPPAEWLPHLADDMATFFRVWSLAQLTNKPCFSPAAQERCGTLLLRSLALCEAQGTHPFHEAGRHALIDLYRQMARSLPPRHWPDVWKEVFALAKHLGLDVESRGRQVGKNGRSNLTPRYVASVLKRTSKAEALSAVFEDGNWVAMRADWKPKSPMLSVVYQQPWPMLSLHAQKQTWLEGAWEWDLTVDGKTFTSPDDWSCVCWTSDKDGDYIELQKSLTDDIHFERQIMLSRDDNWLLLADSVSGLSGYGDNPTPRIEYAMRLHLADGVQISPSLTTRDLTLESGKKTRGVTVYPLALPQERGEYSVGEFIVENRKLILKQTNSGDGLYAPLIFDLNPQSATSIRKVWRSLTVSENMKAVKSDVAAGHRLQLGKRQWLIYHSLKNNGLPRAVLGHHTQYETVIGRFGETGTVKPLVRIEPPGYESEGASDS